MKILRSESGAALVWALAATLVVIILLGSVLTFSYSFYMRSLYNNQSKQAYFNARSVVEAISREIKGETANGSAIIDLLSNPGDRVEIQDISFVGGDVPGSFSAYVELSQVDEIRVTAVSTVGSRTKRVTAVLERNYGGTGLPIGQDFPGLEIPEETVEFVSGSVSIDNKTDGDYYAAGEASVIFINSADFHGRIYAESGSRIEIKQGAKFGGEIYAQSGTEFMFSKLHNHFVGKIYVKNGAVIMVQGKNYTITLDDEGKHVSPDGMDQEFENLIYEYTGSGNGDGGWRDTVYE